MTINIPDARVTGRHPQVMWMPRVDMSPVPLPVAEG